MRPSLPYQSLSSEAWHAPSLSRQVSWLTAHRVLAAFPLYESKQWLNLPVRSPITVARPRGNLTRFPFHSPIEGEHLKQMKRLQTIKKEKSMSIVFESQNGLPRTPCQPHSCEEITNPLSCQLLSDRPGRLDQSLHSRRRAIGLLTN